MFLALLSDLEGAVLKSRNPLLNGISDYLVDVTSAEEDALAENVAQVHGTELMEEMEKDNKMTKVLIFVFFNFMEGIFNQKLTLIIFRCSIVYFFICELFIQLIFMLLSSIQMKMKCHTGYFIFKIII